MAAAEKVFQSLQRRIGVQLPGHGLLTENVIGEARQHCQVYWSKISPENVDAIVHKIMGNCKTWGAADEKFAWLWKSVARQHVQWQADKHVIKVGGRIISWEDLEEAERCSRRKFGLFHRVAPCARSQVTSPCAPVAKVCRACGSTCIKTLLADRAADLEVQPVARSKSDELSSADLANASGKSDSLLACLPEVPPEKPCAPFTPLPSPGTLPSSPGAPCHQQIASNAPRSCLSSRRAGRVSRGSSNRISFSSELVHAVEITSFKDLDYLWSVGAITTFCEWCRNMKPHKTGQLWSQEHGQFPIFVCKECAEVH